MKDRQRLRDEELLMCERARLLHLQDHRPERHQISVKLFDAALSQFMHTEESKAPEQASHEIHLKLMDRPYLRHVCLGGVRTARLYVSEDGLSWRLDPNLGGQYMSQANRDKAREIARRAEIAEGFGLDPRDNWASVKAHIRKRLKPRANDLLELASVKRLLADALARGRRAIVHGDVVFWYEDRELRWQIKTVERPSDAASGGAIWLEGTIVSRNHGRIIVLPYVKRDGTKVPGHTKNAPHDGPARPRHPNEYVEIPFERYDGDLMIGLNGELPYE